MYQGQDQSPRSATHTNPQSTHIIITFRAQAQVTVS